MESLPHEPDGAGQAPAFWPNPSVPANGIHWYDPPVRIEEHLASGESAYTLLNELTQRIGDFPLHAWLLTWTYVTRAGAATIERQRLEEEARRRLEERNQHGAQHRQTLDNAIEETRARLSETKQELVTARREYAEAMSRLGLSCEPDHPTPQQVEMALGDAAPTLDELAGSRQVGPVATAPRAWLTDAGAPLFALLAPLVSGFMLALCLGTLVGILSLTDLLRGDRFLQLAIAGLFGFTIVYVMGELVAGGVGSLARYLELSREHPAMPAFRNGMTVVALLLTGAVILAVAELAAEALGLRELHLQRLQALRRIDAGVDITLLPLWAYGLLGLLISGPYLAYKAAHTWAEYERRLREAVLLHSQRQWVQQQRESADWQLALKQAYRAVQLRQMVDELQGELHNLRTEQHQYRWQFEFDDKTMERLQAAHAAATGETARLQNLILDIIEARERMTAVKQGRETGVALDRLPEPGVS